MSFGNRSNYCSLKDAFGVKSFSIDDNPMRNMEQHTFSYKVEQPQKHQVQEVEKIEEAVDPEEEIIENFHVKCSSVEKHCGECKDCIVKFKRYGPVGTSLNEILNIILICILLFIIIYKPNF